MASYTEEEVAQALSTLLSPDSGPARTSTGERQVTTRYQALQQSIASAFLAKPDLIYTAALVGTERLQPLLQEALTRLIDLRRYLRQSVRFVDPVRSVTPLQNAAQAALDLESAKVSHLQPLTSQPAYHRFRNQTLAFLKAHLPQHVVSGAVVEAPAESRIKAAQTWVDFQAAWPALIEAVGGLAGASSSFSGARLPEAASSVTRKRVRQQMTLLFSRLSQQTAEERLSTAKQDMLEIFAARAALESLSNLPTTSRYYPLTQPVVFSSDADHPSTSPVFTSTLVGPYTLPLPLDLTVEVPGASPETFALPTSINPALEGIQAEAYTSVTIVTGSVGPFTLSPGSLELQVFLIGADGQLYDGSIDLVEGVGRTSTDIAAEIQASWTGRGIPADFLASNAGGSVRLRALSGARLALGSGTVNATLGLPSHGGFEVVDNGWVLLRASDPEPYVITTGVNDLLLLTFKDPTTGNYLTVSKTLSPGSRTAAVMATYIQTTLTNAGVNADYLPMDDGGTFQIISPEGSQYEVIVGSGNINSLLGWTNGQKSKGVDRNSELVVRRSGTAFPLFTSTYGKRSARSIAQELQDFLGSSWQVAASGPYTQQRVSIRYIGTSAASTYISVDTSKFADLVGWLQELSVYGQLLPVMDLARGINKLTTTLVASSTVTQLATTTAYTTGDPTQLRLVKERGKGDVSSPAPLSLHMYVAHSSLLAGEKLRLSDGTLWTITEVTSSYLTATGTSTLSAPLLGVTYEGGPDLSSSGGTCVQVAAGPLQGSYTVVSFVDALTVQVREIVLFIPGGSPYAGAATVGREYLTLAPRVSSSVTLSGPGCTKLFGTTPRTKTPQTFWLLLGEDVRPTPEVGDVVVLRSSGQASLPITRVSGRWLQLQEGRVEGDTYGVRLPEPYAQIRNERQAKLEALEYICKTFLASKYTQARGLADLDQALHKITSVPTTSIPLLQSTLAALDPLTEVIDALIADVKEYVVRRDDVFDQLLNKLREQGADYGIELLGSCRFSEFFALEPSASSYAGALADSLRKFTASNLPITAEEVASRDRLVSSSQGDDPDQVFEEDEGVSGRERAGLPIVRTLDLKE